MSLMKMASTGCSKRRVKESVEVPTHRRPLSTLSI